MSFVFAPGSCLSQNGRLDYLIPEPSSKAVGWLDGLTFNMNLEGGGGLQVALQATNNNSNGSSAELGAQTAFIFRLLQTRVSLGSWSYIWRVQIGRPSFEAV